MSREILFRGKSAETGKWIEGYLSSPRTICHTDTCNNVDEIVIDPSTVCQYTGLKDKADKMIFENDVVRIGGYPNCRGWVRFGSYSDARGKADTNYGWFIDFIQNNGYYRQDFGYWVNRIFVIGNYFDNPELLEGGTGEDD